MNLWQTFSTSWQFWALMSPLAAALTAIFAKVDVKGIPPNVATFVCTVVISVFVSVMLYLSSQAGVVKTQGSEYMIKICALALWAVVAV